VALVRTDVSEECITSIIRVARIDKLGTGLFTVTAVKISKLTGSGLVTRFIGLLQLTATSNNNS
jgi:hypothetical protein